MQLQQRCSDGAMKNFDGKGARQGASLSDAKDPEVLKFANKVRTLSHEALRSKLQIEGW
jgi:hypothetical protein